MVPASKLRELRQFNAQVLRGVPDDMAALERALRGASPEAVRDGLLEVVPAIADRHGRLMATGSAEWYEDVRRSQLGGRFEARTAELPDPDVVRSNVRWAAGALFVENRVSPFETLAGSLERHVMDVGRETVALNTRHDRRAVGWNRVAQADGCDFCVMLSMNGAVYRKQTANFASHDNCRCSCAPSWDMSAPEVPVQAYQASEKTGGMSEAQKARHQAGIDSWLSANRWRLDDFRAELA